MGSWFTKLSNYMGGCCLGKLNSMGGWVEKRVPSSSPRCFFFLEKPYAVKGISFLCVCSFQEPADLDLHAVCFFMVFCLFFHKRHIEVRYNN